jgi:hypothetical protein
MLNLFEICLMRERALLKYSVALMWWYTSGVNCGRFEIA